MALARQVLLIAILELTIVASPASAASIFVDDEKIEGRNIIVIIGDIKDGDQDKFANISQNIDDAVIYFDSSIGAGSYADIKAAIEIGWQIRSMGYLTAALHKSSCQSVCALTWVAGNKRWIGENAFVAFGDYLHTETACNQIAETYVMIGHYLTSLGLSQESIVFATKGVGRLLVLDSRNMKELGIPAAVVSATWIEEATYPNGPLPPPPIQITPAPAQPFGN